MQQGIKILCQLVITMFIASCATSELSYRLSQYDLNEKTLLYHKQKLKNFLNSGKTIKVYWVNIPRRRDLTFDNDSILKVDLDTLFKEEYKTIAYVFDRNTEGNAIVLYEIFNNKRYGIYLHHTPRAHLPFMYEILFKYPTYIILIGVPREKTLGALSCKVVLDNFESFKEKMRENKLKMRIREERSVRQILKEAVIDNIYEWNLIKTLQINSDDCNSLPVNPPRK